MSTLFVPGTRTTSAGTLSMTSADVNGNVAFGADCTYTCLAGLPTGTRVTLYATADGVDLTIAASGGESISGTTTAALSAGQGRILVKETATTWRLLQLGSGIGSIGFIITLSTSGPSLAVRQRLSSGVWTTYSTPTPDISVNAATPPVWGTNQVQHTGGTIPSDSTYRAWNLSTTLGLVNTADDVSLGVGVRSSVSLASGGILFGIYREVAVSSLVFSQGTAAGFGANAGLGPIPITAVNNAYSVGSFNVNGTLAYGINEGGHLGGVQYFTRSSLGDNVDFSYAGGDRTAGTAVNAYANKTAVAGDVWLVFLVYGTGTATNVGVRGGLQTYEPLP